MEERPERMWAAYNRAVCVKVGYLSSNKMKSVCGSQWLVVHECVCLTDVWVLQALVNGS